MNCHGVVTLLVGLLMTSGSTEESADQKMYDMIRRTSRDMATVMGDIKSMKYRQEVEMETLQTRIQKQNTEIEEMNERMNEQEIIITNMTRLLQQISTKIEKLLEEKENLTGEIAELPGEESCCVLPERPPLLPVDPASGTRFGLAPDSRWEFDNGKDLFRSDSTWQLEFKTMEPDGIILYAADVRQVDFVALYIKDGYVVYGYNLGDDPALIASTNRYNDGQWHTVAFSRDKLNGDLVVDGTDQNAGSAAGISQFLSVEMPYYIGGVTSDIALGGAKNLEGLTVGLTGCLRNLQHDGTGVGAPDNIVSTKSCSANTETGTFFGADGGYVKLQNNVVVGFEIDINLEIKPRSQNGVIFSVVGDTGDFLVLQMMNGELLFSVDNGAGEVITTWKPILNGTLCNGKWHTIICQKAMNVVVIEVDGVFGLPGTGEAGVSRTDTDDPFYVGGVTEFHRGIKTTADYIGCIRNFEFGEDRPQNLGLGTPFGDVNLNSCPTN